MGSDTDQGSSKWEDCARSTAHLPTDDAAHAIVLHILLCSPQHLHVLRRLLCRHAPHQQVHTQQTLCEALRGAHIYLQNTEQLHGKHVPNQGAHTARTHGHTHTHTHAQAHTRTHKHTHARTSTFAQAHTRTHKHTHARTSTFAQALGGLSTGTRACGLLGSTQAYYACSIYCTEALGGCHGGASKVNASVRACVCACVCMCARVCICVRMQNAQKAPLLSGRETCSARCCACTLVHARLLACML